MKNIVEDMAGDEGGSETETKDVEEDKTTDITELSPPHIKLPTAKLCADALKCLNMMGILWAGRGHKRRFMQL